MGVTCEGLNAGSEKLKTVTGVTLAKFCTIGINPAWLLGYSCDRWITGWNENVYFINLKKYVKSKFNFHIEANSKKEYRREYYRKWREANRERWREYMKKYKTDHKNTH